jgi:hypothetical protein
MSSEVVAYGEAPLSRAAGDVETARDIEPDGVRGKDWPLALTVFVPVFMAYAGVGYAVYAVVRTLL